MSYLEALQETLAAEHAAVYVIGVLGAQTSQTQSPGLYETLIDSYAEHRAARDLLVGLVIGAGGDPVVAETAYALPDDLSRSDVLEQRALEVQRALATSYAVGEVDDSPIPAVEVQVGDNHPARIVLSRI